MFAVHLIRYQRAEIELQIVRTQVLSKATLNSLSELPQILSKVIKAFSLFVSCR